MGNQAYNLGFASIGKDVTIWPLAKIISPELISIGDSVIIDDFVFIMAGKGTQIGSFVHIASFDSITGGGELVMEDFVVLSSGVRIFTGTDDFSGNSLAGPAVPYPFRKPIRSFVHLRKHTLIGANSVILPGVTIGEGVSIGANSLVLRDCEPWTIYAGSPAKPIKARNRDKMLELESELIKTLYDQNGNYIPAAIRGM